MAMIIFITFLQNYPPSRAELPYFLELKFLGEKKQSFANKWRASIAMQFYSGHILLNNYNSFFSQVNFWILQSPEFHTAHAFLQLKYITNLI